MKHYKIEIKLQNPARAFVDFECFVSAPNITEACKAARLKVPDDHRLVGFGRAVEQT